MALTDIDAGFVVADVPGKGRGVIAQRHFQRGDVILSEAPLFTQRIVRGNSTVLAALAQCTPEQQQQFYSLHNCHIKRFQLAQGIFETNVLPCGGNDAHGHIAAQGGLFLTGARFNSSCVPNVNNRWDARAQLLVFRAVRDIEAGEEMCLGYGKLLATRDERRVEMREKFGFECQCEACSLDGAALEESDARRECLGLLYDAHLKGEYKDPLEGIGEVKVTPSVPSLIITHLISQAVVALRLLREERLPVFESTFYLTGFHCCASVSDFANARSWACRALDASRAAFGDEHATHWKRYISDPRTYGDAGSMGKRTFAAPDSPLWGMLGL